MPFSKQKKENDTAEELNIRMRATQEAVNKIVEEIKAKQILFHDRKAKAAKMIVGDKVLVKILAFDTMHKIQNRFEADTYEVIAQPNSEVPVFDIKSPEGSIRRIHRNHLFQLGFIKDDIQKEGSDQDANLVPEQENMYTAEEITAAAREKSEQVDKDVLSDDSDDEEYYILETTFPTRDARTPLPAPAVKPEEIEVERVATIEKTDIEAKDSQLICRL